MALMVENIWNLMELGQQLARQRADLELGSMAKASLLARNGDANHRIPTVTKSSYRRSVASLVGAAVHKLEA